MLCRSTLLVITARRSLGVASQTLNPFVGIEAGQTQTVPADQYYGTAAATTLPQTITETTLILDYAYYYSLQRC